ncbi:unnamed protein product [Clonostachys rhizophaga]|uniref:Meiotically up-regulated gene 157 protein n=1 Tax=Clonostachys rhizophaga TaxID=160324 RepID=A0A9N9V5C0_9HYPO|nr:unnamed protein product [Clonostachys rhizophaga]
MLLSLLILALTATAQECPNYVQYAAERHEPFSPGIYEFPFQRPTKDCRTYSVDKVEEIIEGKNATISDPDLQRLFENTWPSTLDTTVRWTGVSSDNPDEELAFIITGDINAMWMRDSANQLQSYKSIVSEYRIASLYRGAINLQARYMTQYPYCNAFQPPPESGMSPQYEHDDDVVTPAVDHNVVFECKYEIDSMAAFFQLSWDYYEVTKDAEFFGKFGWVEAVKVILSTAKDLMRGTYADDGSVIRPPYTWLRTATSASETVFNKGTGAPVRGNIGLVRSFFRPSDDSCIYQYFIPGNIMFSRYVKATSEIMKTIDEALAKEMEDIAEGIAKGIEEHAIVNHPEFGEVYAFEIDGFGSFNLMDDANIPSLLSIPHLGFKESTDSIYQNTRNFVLSKSNPYFAYGPVINATGGPHVGPGNGWPMAVVMQLLTSDDDEEITHGLKELLGSTSNLGLMHETVNSHDDSQWTRPWFAWANGLFGQMILDLEKRKPHLLEQSFQS